MKNITKNLILLLFVILLGMTQNTLADEEISYFTAGYYLTEPFAGQEFVAGDSLIVTWECMDSDSLYFYNLDTTYAFALDIYLWDFIIGEWVQIGDSIPGLQERYAWFIPLNKVGTYFRVKIVDRNFDGALSNINGDFFYINSPPPPNPPKSATEVVTAGKDVIYPNPIKNNSILTLSLLSGQYKIDNLRIKIIDVSGKVVLNTQQFTKADNNTISLSINNFSTGAYVMELDDGIKKTTHKLVVMPD